MSAPVLTGAETALQAAVLAALAADDGVKALFGDPPRMFDGAGARPAYPFLEIARHETKDVGGQGAPALGHRIDLRVLSRWGGRAEAREAVGAVRAALDAAALSLTDHRLVYCFAVYSDVLMLRDLATLRGVLRLKALTEPLAV